VSTRNILADRIKRRSMGIPKADLAPLIDNALAHLQSKP
jgi:hypothetical protein